jgi:hypothetical protein
VEFEKILGHIEAHVLRAAITVGTIEKTIALRHRCRQIFRDIEIDGIADLGNQRLFGVENIARAQTQRLGKAPFGKYIDSGAELEIARVEHDDAR